MSKTEQQIINERSARASRVFARINPKKFSVYPWDNGTKACLAGHICRNAWFRAQGLKIGAYAETPNWPSRPIVEFEGIQGTAALAKFFGVSESLTEEVFHLWIYDSGRASDNAKDLKAAIAQFDRIKKEQRSYD